MREKFIDKSISREGLGIIKVCNEILAEYESKGLDLSLRQLYYQLVARALIENTEQSYKRIGGLVSDARLVGLMDWDMIKDRGREMVKNQHWSSPAEILDACAKSFRYSLRDDQPYYIEVMVEKQALEGVLEPVCRDLDVPFTANKGYSSSSALYEAGKRIERELEGLSGFGDQRQARIIYLGDHDPSGIDMARDVQERLSLFAGADLDVKVERVALNMDQIQRYKPPPNPAKMSDSRAKDYVKRYGTKSWELDALDPDTLADLVRGAVKRLTDAGLFAKAVGRQARARERLKALSRQFDEEQGA